MIGKATFSTLMFAGFLAVVQASGQSRINSTVEVERDYEGKIMSAVKSPVVAEVDDTLLNFNLNFDYTTFYNPYGDLYRFSSVLAAEPGTDGKVIYPWMYARLAAAWPLAPSADVYISPRFGDRFSLSLYYNHDSFWGKVPETEYQGSHVGYSGEKIYGDRMKNRAGAVLGYRWSKGELGVRASYSDGLYALNNVAGMSQSQILDGYSNRFRHFNARISVRSENPDPNAFYYNAVLGYRYFGNRRGLTENIADADISLGATIRKSHRLYIRFNGSFSRNGVWTVSPTYRWEGGRWRINAGVALSSDYGTGIMRNGLHTLLYPDVSVDFEAVRNAFWIRLDASGENKLYYRYDLYGVNPWADGGSSAFMYSEPLSAGLSLRGLVRDRFSYSAGVKYSRINNFLSFMSDGAYQTPFGGAADMFAVNGMLRWKSRDFFALAEVDYRYFPDRTYVLMVPAVELNAVLEYNLRQRLFIRADCRFLSQTTGLGVLSAGGQVSYCSVPASVDVGLRISYAINTSLLVYVEGNNLANSKIQYFMNYVEPGMNIGAGICLKL